MKTETAIEDCIKKPRKSVWGEWRKGNWKLLIKNVVREKLEEEERQWKRKSWPTHP